MNLIEIRDYLEKILEEEYPDTCIEGGENWEVIAKIFYEKGLLDSLKEREIR